MHIRTALLSAAVAGFAIALPAAAQSGVTVDSSTVGAAPAAASARPARPPRVRRDIITAEQARAASGRDAYEVVDRLHPNWLRKHGADATNPGGSSAVVVFYEGREIGGVSALHEMPVEQIVTIQYYDAIAASSLFGPGHEQGVIAVTAH
jgi:hypothetical protein